MPTTEPTRCKAENCDARIRYAISDTTGKRIPIDAEPDPAGHLAVRQDEPGGPLRARPCPPEAELLEGEKRGTSHFKTCKDPGRFSHRDKTPPGGETP